MPSARLRIPPVQPDSTMNDRSNSKTFFIRHLRVNAGQNDPMEPGSPEPEHIYYIL